MIPAMQNGRAESEIVAIASRDIARARSRGRALGIRAAYGSYEELLGRSGGGGDLQPASNHLHVPWSIRAAEAGKHVLCEKPIGL